MRGNGLHPVFAPMTARQWARNPDQVFDNTKGYRSQTVSEQSETATKVNA